jgi:hypothetical protein
LSRMNYNLWTACSVRIIWEHTLIVNTDAGIGEKEWSF